MSTNKSQHAARWTTAWGFATVLTLWSALPALGVAEFVQHTAGNQVFGEPAGVTMLEPAVPREGDAVDVWVRIGYSFFYTNVAIYYTTDGTDPAGSFGVAGNGSTSVLTPMFVRNEPNAPNNIDWWKATFPAGTRDLGDQVKYTIGAWHSGGGIEVFANNTGCSDGTCDDPAGAPAVFSYSVGLPWPGAGFGTPNPGVGYPNVHFWKEEAVSGNNYMNVMVDQNGSIYDIYYPSAGCVQGMGTTNEGYADGNDTFPPGAGGRGQMNVNQCQAGLRIDGVTYWLANDAGAYSNHTQSYITDTNAIRTAQRLSQNGYNIDVEQFSYCPIGITFPNYDDGMTPQRGLYVMRYVLTNNGAAARTIGFYYFADFNLNATDAYDGMFVDGARQAMVAYDNTLRNTSMSGEYNPTFFSGYEKNVSLYMAAAMKACDAVGGATGSPASATWRDMGSADNSQGWIGTTVTLGPGAAKEIDVLIVGGFDDQAGFTQTYSYQMDNAVDWFMATSMDGVQTATEDYWTGWLNAGVTIDTPDDQIDAALKRSLLATALHVDGANGGVIAGMHNGAYPFIWPRDALYAAVTLDRTGHTDEAGEVFRYLRDVTYRADEEPGRKGFWYQKYTTDGYSVWTAPQVDETANVPWAGYYHYLTTGDIGFLNSYYQMFYEAARAMSEDSNIDSRLYYDDANALMHSNNVWEDSFDDFLYSNATVERGLRDAAKIADATGHGADSALFTSRADAIHGGLNGRLDWNGENTDISQLGLVWPFETHSPTDPRMALVIDRMNGVANDRFGNNHPLVNYGGEWQDLINRYWGDTYWNYPPTSPNPNGSPWFLSTMWYGQYYAQRQDHNPGKADIDNHYYRINRCLDFVGPAGLGAEQMAPESSLLYPGQPDFKLQTAWPNAWESMSFFVDSIMLFLDHRPDASTATLYLEPKLPTAWNTMTFDNLAVGNVRVDVACAETATEHSNTFTNVTGGTLHYDTKVRVPAGSTVARVLQGAVPVSYTYDSGIGVVHVTGTIDAGAGASTTVRVLLCDSGDSDGDGDVDIVDFGALHDCFDGPDAGLSPGCECLDIDGDNDVDLHDFAAVQNAFTG